MPTLYNYLATLSSGGQPLIFSDQPLSESQVTAASGRPYVVVHELRESPIGNMYGHQDILEAIVEVQIHQAQTSKAARPSRNDATELYYKIWDSVKYVDSWVFGQRLIAMHHASAMPPKYNAKTAGLMGYIQFRLLFPRG